jgi:uncharacterized protein VirK/YbjX
LFSFKPRLAQVEMYFPFVQSAAIVLAERRSVRPVLDFVARGLLHPAPTMRLLRFFSREDGHGIPRSIVVDSLLKIGRAHVRLGLTAGQRVDLRIAHHAALRRAMRPEVLTGFLGGAPIRLAEMPGDRADEYELLLLRAPFGDRREGEATLSLRSRASGVRLADVTFTIGGSAQTASCLRIGGVQGPPGPEGRAAVKAATKALDGLRPNAVVIEAAYQLALGFGASTIFATSLSHHVLRGTRKGAVIQAGLYDAFWEELGGLRLPDGDYLLPRQPSDRNAADVPVRRRKHWERRQRRLDDLAVEIRLSMAGLGEARMQGADHRPTLPHCLTRLAA